MKKKIKRKEPYYLGLWMGFQMDKKLRMIAKRNGYLRMSDFVKFLFQREINDFEQEMDMGGTHE